MSFFQVTQQTVIRNRKPLQVTYTEEGKTLQLTNWLAVCFSLHTLFAPKEMDKTLV